MTKEINIDKISSIGRLTSEILSLQADIKSLQSSANVIMDNSITINEFRIITNGSYSNKDNFDTTAYLSSNANVSNAILNAINEEIAILNRDLEVKLELLRTYTKEI